MVQIAYIEYADEILSRHIERKTGVKFDQNLLRDYLAAHWNQVSLLAHSIHQDVQQLERIERIHGTGELRDD